MRVKINWSQPSPANGACFYDHVTAETPLGRFLLTWKGWKEDPMFGFDETPWGEAEYGGCWRSVQDAQKWAEDEFLRRINECLIVEPQPSPDS